MADKLPFQVIWLVKVIVYYSCLTPDFFDFFVDTCHPNNGNRGTIPRLR